MVRTTEHLHFYLDLIKPNTEIWIMYFLYLLQIAPAESPDSKMRMVIVTGPPEAQFKVITDSYLPLLFDIISLVGGTTGCWKVLTFFCLPSPPGSGQNLWQTEGRELLWAKGRSQTWDSHQDGSCCCRKSDWQGRQDGEPQNRIRWCTSSSNIFCTSGCFK